MRWCSMQVDMHGADSLLYDRSGEISGHDGQK